MESQDLSNIAVMFEQAAKIKDRPGDAPVTVDDYNNLVRKIKDAIINAQRYIA